MSYTTENISAEYNIYYGENVNYDDIINSFTNVESYGEALGGTYNIGRIFTLSGNLYFTGAASGASWNELDQINLTGTLRFANLQDQLVFGFRGFSTILKILLFLFSKTAYFSGFGTL